MIIPSSTLVSATFDFNVLGSYYASGANLSLSLQRDVLASGLPSTVTSGGALVPPWQRPETELDLADLGQFQRTRPLVDLSDPDVDQPGASDAFKSLFALHKGLAFMRDIARVAQENERAGLLLDHQFQLYLEELTEFVDTTAIDGITLLNGIKRTDLVSSTAVTSPSEIDSVFGLPLVSSEFEGGVVTTVREDPIPTLTGTETFTIDVTNGGGTTSVAIDLSQVAGGLTIDNVVDFINGELLAQGVGSSFSVERFNEEAYGLKLNILTGDSVSFSTTDPTEPALYVAGSYGGGLTADGFVTKFDDLAAADPSQGFLASIHTDAADEARAVTVDSQGFVYTVGTTQGDLGEQGIVGVQDVFLNKFDGSGNLVSSVRLGASDSASAFGVAIDSQDNVIVVGHTLSPLTDAAVGGGSDTFVTKFDSAGREIFTRQTAPFASDSGLTVTVDANDDIFIAGVTASAIDATQTHAGANDAFVTKLNSDGTLAYNKQFGSSGEDTATAIAVDNAGNLYVTANVNGDAVVRKYADSAVDDPPIFEVNLGALGSDGQITGIALDAGGEIYLTGYTSNAALGGPIVQAHSGGLDAFVTRLTDLGASATIDFTSYLGGGTDDRAHAISVDQGSVYIAGETDGTIPGATQVGAVDGFIAKLDAAGTTQYVRQFGGALDYRARGISFDSDGTSVLTKLGLPVGAAPPPSAKTVTTETIARAGQSFSFSIDGGPAKRVVVEAGDTMEVLAARISNALGLSGRASLRSEGDRAFLAIEALNGSRVELIAGPEGMDALRSLGLEPALLLGEALSEEEREAADDATFELGFVGEVSVVDRGKATDAVALIENAMLEVRKAFRFLTEGPPPDDPLADLPAPPPEFLARRIAAFEDALLRIQVISPQAASIGFLV